MRVCQIRGASMGSTGEEGFEAEDDEVGDKWSLVVAIWVKSKARSLSRSVAG